MFINKAMVYGNITRDPEMKALPSGMTVTSFSVATNRKYKDKNDNMVEQTEFHNIVVFGKQAENVAKYLSKGSGVWVEGRLQTRSWDSDGKKMYRTEIVADYVQFGPKKGDSTTTQSSDSQDVPDYPEEEINPEDIPF